MLCPEPAALEKVLTPSPGGCYTLVMKYSLLILPLLASLASAQDDVWKTLAKGDRVQITFRSGNTILGNLDSKPGDPRVRAGTVDYATADEITLDLSLEYPGLNGTMTIAKKEIKEIRKLQSLDAQTMKRIQEELKRIQAQTAADEAARRAGEAERDKAAQAARAVTDKLNEKNKVDKDKGDALLKEFDEIQKGNELLKRFPPDKYGPQSLKDMADMAVRRQPVPPDLREFADPEVQRLWTKAVAALKEGDKGAPKKEEGPGEKK